MLESILRLGQLLNRPLQLLLPLGLLLGGRLHRLHPQTGGVLARVGGQRGLGVRPAQKLFVGNDDLEALMLSLLLLAAVEDFVEAKLVVLPRYLLAQDDPGDGTKLRKALDDVVQSQGEAI